VALLFVSMGGIKPDQPDIAPLDLHLEDLSADWLGVQPLTIFFTARSFGIALCDQFLQGITAALLWFHYQTAAFNRDAYLSAWFQVQDIEQCGWNGQHDRAADLAKICNVHGVIFQYNNC
jgi:hypothetical protein